MTQANSPNTSCDDATTRASQTSSEGQTADNLTQYELGKIFKPGNLSLGVHVECVPIGRDSRDAVRELVVHTSNPSAARADGSVRRYMQFARSYQGNPRLSNRSSLGQSRALAGQLNSQSPFSVYPLNSAQSAFIDKLSHVEQIRFSDFEVETGVDGVEESCQRPTVSDTLLCLLGAIVE